MIHEFLLIDRIKKAFPRSLQGEIGLGDDADVFSSRKPSQKWLIATDVIVEDVDFRWKSLIAESVGRKSLAVNLSDLAAMGAKPYGCLVTLGIPSHATPRWIHGYFLGLKKIAKQYGVRLLGGDLSSSKKFFSSITVLGTAGKNIVKRQGARKGDWLGVTGTLGGSILKHHYAFSPRIQEGLFLSNEFRPTSMIDISDGLLQDLSHILKASKVGTELELTHVPISKDAMKLSKGSPRRALLRALKDGEDFELLFTVSDSKKRKLDRAWKRRFPRVRLSWLGRIDRHVGKISWTKSGKKCAAPKLKAKGYTHF